MILNKILRHNIFNKSEEKEILDDFRFCNNLYTSDCIIDKEKFNNILCFAYEIINDSNLNNTDEHPIIDLIRILGRRIQSDYMGHLLYCGKEESLYDDFGPTGVFFPLYKIIQDENGDLKKIDSFIDRKYYTKKINLSRDLVLPWPWRRDRLINCILKIGKGRDWGEWRVDEYNHIIDVWLPMGIVWVYGGNHSITIGIIQGGEIEPTYYTDISKLYKYIKCDGEYFIEISTCKKISKVKSPELAAIFEIGRMMEEKNISFI